MGDEESELITAIVGVLDEDPQYRKEEVGDKETVAEGVTVAVEDIKDAEGTTPPEEIKGGGVGETLITERRVKEIDAVPSPVQV